MYYQNAKRKIAYEEKRGLVYNYIPRKNPKARKKPRPSFFVLSLAVIVWAIFLVPSLYVNFENFLGPVYINRFHNRSLNFEAEKLYAPTLNYINNLNFLGQNMLVPIPKKGKEKILKINSSGNFLDLELELQSILNEYKNLHAGIFVYDYTSAKTLSMNADEVFPTASIIKIPILLDLFNRSKNLEKEGFSPIDINSKRTFEEFHRTEGSGELQYSNSGGEYSLDYLAKIMIRKSDNSATNMLIEENGGINETNASLRHWGFEKTRVENWLPDLEGTNVSTPRELAIMLYNIDNQAFLPSKYATKIKDYMSKVENRTLIRSQIPDDVVLIHKTGDIGKMLGDAGIIYTPSGKKYIMVVMVKRPHNDYSARDLIQKVSAAVYKKLGA